MTPLTPEVRAERVEIVVDEVGDPRDPQNYVNHEATGANIAAAIREAVAAEREAILSELIALANSDNAYGFLDAVDFIRRRSKS